MARSPQPWMKTGRRARKSVHLAFLVACDSDPEVVSSWLAGQNAASAPGGEHVEGSALFRAVLRSRARRRPMKAPRRGCLVPRDRKQHRHAVASVMVRSQPRRSMITSTSTKEPRNRSSRAQLREPSRIV